MQNLLCKNSNQRNSGGFCVCCVQGAAVLRMLSEFLTEPVFAKGLSVSSKSLTRSHHIITTATVWVCVCVCVRVRTFSDRVCGYDGSRQIHLIVV